jgi:hypothetical protein
VFVFGYFLGSYQKFPQPGVRTVPVIRTEQVTTPGERVERARAMASEFATGPVVIAQAKTTVGNAARAGDAAIQSDDTPTLDILASIKR